MDEKEIARLNAEIRDAEQAEARHRADAEALVSRKRGANEDLLSNDNLREINEAFKPADAALERSRNLKMQLNRALGRVAEDAPEQPRRRTAEQSIALRWLASDVYKQLRSSRALDSQMNPIGNTAAVEVMSRDALLDGLRTRLFSNAADVGSGLLTPDYKSLLVEQFTRPVRLLDLITLGRTDTDTVDWVVENTRTDAAAETPYGTALPESSYGFSHRQTTVRRAGHHTTATRGILADAGQTRTLLDNRLMTGLDRRIEQQVWQGNGIGENIKGITEYTIPTLDGTGLPKLDVIHNAMTKMRIDTEGAVDPQHLWIHPTDYEALILDTDANGAYRFGSPADRLQPTIWGLRPVVSTLAPLGAPSVADFKELATLWLREGAQIAMSDQHSDFFLKGLVAVKAETRLAFAVTQEKAMVTVENFGTP